mgnify:CR=1 FL=1
MNNNLLKISLLSLLLCIGGLFIVINAEDSISACPIDTINGKLMYRYTVERGEGLYRVSKKFGVSQNVIISTNPSIQADGLKLGQVIHIPVDQVLEAVKAEEIVDTSYIYHTIEPKETLYGLSRRFGVPVKVIEELNPTLVPKLPYGQLLRLPRNENTVKAQLEISQPVVIKSSERVVMTKSDSSTMNVVPVVASDSILLLLSNSQDSTPTVDLKPVPLDDGFSFENINLNDSGELIPMRIAYLLPLMLNASKRDANVDRFLEFYEGSLLAINDLQRQGLKLEIYVYDIEKNDISLQAVLQNPELKNIDAIIGPAYPAQVNIVSQFVKRERIPTIIPFTPNVAALDTNKYLLRFNLSDSQEADLMAEYMSERKNDVNVVYVDTEYEEESDLSRTIADRMKKSHIQVTNVKVDNLKTVLKSNKENLLIFKSMRLQDIQNYFDDLATLSWDYHIALAGQYSWGKSRVPVKMYYASVFDSLDVAKEDVYAVAFNHYYNYPLSNIRPRYDQLGYDITVYTARMLYENQMNNVANLPMNEVIPTIYHGGIQSEIHFEQVSPKGGFVNRGHIAEREADK